MLVQADVDEFVEELLDQVGAVVPDSSADPLADGVQVFDVWPLRRGGLRLEAKLVARGSEFIATAGEFGEAWRSDVARGPARRALPC